MKIMPIQKINLIKKQVILFVSFSKVIIVSLFSICLLSACSGKKNIELKSIAIIDKHELTEKYSRFNRQKVVEDAIFQLIEQADTSITDTFLEIKFLSKEKLPFYINTNIGFILHSKKELLPPFNLEPIEVNVNKLYTYSYYYPTKIISRYDNFNLKNANEVKIMILKGGGFTPSKHWHTNEIILSKKMIGKLY